MSLCSNVCQCIHTHVDINILTAEVSINTLQDMSFLALELVQLVFGRAGLSAAHSGECFIVRPRLHGDTQTRSGPLFVFVFFIQSSVV